MAKKKNYGDDEFTVSDLLRNIIKDSGKFTVKNPAQKEFIKLIAEKEIIICGGPSGCGKSFLSIAKAIALLKDTTNKFEKILIYTPAVEVEENHGYLPGAVEDKIMPYVESSLSLVDKLIGKSSRERMMQEGLLEVKALAYIRGANIDNSILIMEEAQNMSVNQMKTLLTRIGENSKFIISGDMDQSDRFKNVKNTGLYDAINRLKTIDKIGFFEFSVDDIVRNPIISEILRFYNSPKNDVDSPKTEKEKRIIPSVPKEDRSELNEGVPQKNNKKPKKNKLSKFLVKYFTW